MRLALPVIALALAACTDDPAPVPRDEVERGDAGPRLRDAGFDAGAPLDAGPRPDARSCALEDRCGNRIDDDCDGETDEGCSLEVTVGDRVDGRTFGGTGGTGFSRICYPGQVARGLHGASDGVQCVRPVITDDGNGNLTIRFEPGDRLGPEGGSGGTSFSYDCAPSRVAMGMRGRTGLYVDAFGISCQAASATDPDA